MTPHYQESIADIFAGIRVVPLWGRMGWADIRRRYRRTVFGPFWSSISLAIFVVALGLVWANLWNLDPKEYLSFLASGMLAWLLFTAFIAEGCTVFVAAEGLIKQLPVNYTMLICAMIWRNLIVFFHNFVIYIPVCIYAGLPLRANMLLIVPGIILLCINGFWIAMVLGLLCCRYRDIQQVVTSILQISMFVTPILWKPSQLGGRVAWFVDYNLLYHYVTIVREPLLGQPVSAWSWAFVSMATLVGWGLAIFIFSRFRRRVPYWL